MKKFWLVAAALALAPLTATAASPRELHKQVEASMLVTGEIQINELGAVSELQLEQPEKLPGTIAEFVRGQVSKWTFEPVLRAGKAVPARSRMSVLVVGKNIDKDRVSIGMRSAVFPGPAPGEGEQVTAVSMKPPRYPLPASSADIGGSVYLALKIGRDGSVIDAIVEQVNLRAIASDKQMTRLRKMFADSSLAAAREWTFQPPISGEAAAEEHWSVRVPVNFEPYESKRRTGYGIWQVYVPGPRETIPWKTDAQAPGFSPDALAEGGVYTASAAQGLRLLTPLDGG